MAVREHNSEYAASPVKRPRQEFLNVTFVDRLSFERRNAGEPRDKHGTPDLQFGQRRLETIHLQTNEAFSERARPSERLRL